ncbi:fumarylpyruvate hydrolase [Rhizobium sp. RU20A]|uniref:fumarylacetoacetate hydrolase family protein n=1 Tax=Rhizobium sp. RU20A TaxID=1907412 RepID=UPI000956F880|nr:fumarylacetoacetate hydrolase family protein [Rhizobium sp. RU20A]SIQ15039.1 fumarylpyruvate hydrolase [Rhizobium sp. RU20A]
MQPLFTPPAPILLPIADENTGFPVRRVYCVGRNYADHAREMGHEPNRDPPFFFQKNPDNLLTGGRPFPYPAHSAEVHHEVEFVAVLSKGGSDIAPDEALSHVYGYAVGIDFTRRDLQAAAKAAGKPWTAAKAFEHSAPISAIMPAARIGHPEKARIWLDVNGTRRQAADIADMTWGMADIIAHASRLFTLAPGDVIFTGTPAGVGPVTRGDTITCGIDGIGILFVTVA